MSKKKKSQKPNNKQTEVKAPEESLVAEEVETEQEVSMTKTQTKKENKKGDNKKSQKKPKEKGKLKRKARETMSELKKVIWPSFGDVVKKTGVVLVVVLVFAVVIFGIDYCLSLLVGLLRK